MSIASRFYMQFNVKSKQKTKSDLKVAFYFHFLEQLSSLLFLMLLLYTRMTKKSIAFSNIFKKSFSINYFFVFLTRIIIGHF